MNLFFSDAELLENFKLLEICPHDFDEVLHVSSNDNRASGHTKFIPEVTPRVWDITSKRIKG